MSVRDRLEDAETLFAANRRVGALVSVLIAFAGTARKRYPREKFKDKDSFIKFFEDEFGKYVPTRINLHFRGKLTPVQHILYEFVRCELVHEAELPEDVRFSDSGHASFFGMEVTPDAITFNATVIDTLIRMVQNAPENAHLFPSEKT